MPPPQGPWAAPPPGGMARLPAPPPAGPRPPTPSSAERAAPGGAGPRALPSSDVPTGPAVSATGTAAVTGADPASGTAASSAFAGGPTFPDQRDATGSDAGLTPVDRGAPAADADATLQGIDDASTLGATPTLDAAPTLDEADWLDRLCPYLLSEDGTYRSTEPDPDHRCTAQDPPGTLPIAFQERYCLTERHVRCEMYKFAQSAREAALGSQDGGPAAQVSSARFRPSVRSVPVAVGPSRTASSEDARSRRPSGVVVAAIGGGILLLLVILALALSGGGDGGPGAGASPSAPPATIVPATPAPPTEPPDLASEAPQTSGAPASGAPSDAPVLIEYEVQEGEALVRIAETFGTTRARILAANDVLEPPMRDRDPYTEAGDIIFVPVSPEMSADDIEAQPGFQGYAEE